MHIERETKASSPVHRHALSPEIGHFQCQHDAVAAAQQQILWLQVEVANVIRAHILHGRGQLLHKISAHILRQRFMLFDVRRQIARIAQLHHNVNASAKSKHTMQLTCVGFVCARSPPNEINYFSSQRKSFISTICLCFSVFSSPISCSRFSVDDLDKFAFVTHLMANV